MAPRLIDGLAARQLARRGHESQIVIGGKA